MLTPQPSSRQLLLQELRRLNITCHELPDGTTVLVSDNDPAAPAQPPARLLLPERAFERFVRRRRPLSELPKGDPRLRVLGDVALDILYTLESDMSPLIALGIRMRFGRPVWFEERGPMEPFRQSKAATGPPTLTPATKH
ncbi:MAG: hypothetical protein WAS07_15290 [Micropruina sp.]|nr:hypothetical protein [Micropruina sp.]